MGRRRKGEIPILKNPPRIRDARANQSLKQHGIPYIRFWEHEIEFNVSECVDKILEVIPPDVS
jgi:very-short-patch-repair endonuclease